MTAPQFQRLKTIARSLERLLPSRRFYPVAHQGESWAIMFGVIAPAADPTVSVETLRQYADMLAREQPSSSVRLLTEAAEILERR